MTLFDFGLAVKLGFSFEFDPDLTLLIERAVVHLIIEIDFEHKYGSIYLLVTLWFYYAVRYLVTNIGHCTSGKTTSCLLLTIDSSSEWHSVKGDSTDLTDRTEGEDVMVRVSLSGNRVLVYNPFHNEIRGESDAW